MGIRRASLQLHATLLSEAVVHDPHRSCCSLSVRAEALCPHMKHLSAVHMKRLGYLLAQMGRATYRVCCILLRNAFAPSNVKYVRT